MERRHVVGWRGGAVICTLLLAVLAVAFTPASAATTPGADAPLSGPTLQLFQAVEVNDMAGVKTALKNGARLEVKNASGKTAADVAVDKGHFIIAHFLLSARTAAPPKPAAQPAAPARTKRATRPRQLTTGYKPKSTPGTGDARQYPLPPRKPRVRAAAQSPGPGKFGRPPRKPPTPIPEATDIAEVPGLSDDDPDGLASLAEPSDTPSTGDAETPSAAAASEDQGTLGPVGRFFDTLLNLVRPDAPETRQPTAAPAPSREPAAERDEAPSDLAGLDTPDRPGADASGDDLDLPTIDKEGEQDDGPDLADLDKLDQDGPSLDDPSAPSDAAVKDEGDDALAALDEELQDEVVEVPQVRRIDPSDDEIQQAKPIVREPAPRRAASSPAGRTVERLQSLVGEKPEEDEFGLPNIEVPGSEQEGEASDPLIVDLDEDKTDDAGDGDLPTSDDPLADQLPLLDEEEPRSTAENGVPQAAPRTPVQALPAPRRRSPRYQSTMDRLRRLNEAVSREVRVNPDAILSERRRAERLAQETGQAAPLPGTGERTMPPSPVKREKLTSRETSSSRVVDRLERIRRSIYTDEMEAEKAEQQKRMAAAKAREQARMAAEQAKLTARADSAAPDAPPEADSPPKSVVGKLAEFFKAQEREQAANTATPQTYRQAPDQGAQVPVAADEGGKIAKDALTPEEKPGQSPGTMAPGFLENLSRLFTDQKAAQDGWSADVEVKDPLQQGPPPAELRPVDGAGTSPPLAAPADAPGGAWTTTVQMNTQTGDPLVLQVSKTPDAASAPPPSSAAPPSTAAPAPAVPQPQPQTLAAATPPAGPASDDDLPALDSEPRPEEDDDLPALEGDDPPSAADDLPSLEGDEPRADTDDLPPAEGDNAPAQAAGQPAQPRQRRGPAPYSDPLRAPDPIPSRDTPAVPQRTLPRLAELKPGPEDPTSGRGNLRLTPNETLTDDSRRFPSAAKAGVQPPKGGVPQVWPVTELAKNDVAKPVQRTRPAVLSRTSLTGATFTLGESVSLESALPPEEGVDGTNQCVKKNRGTTLFCVEPVDWPQDLRPKFVVPTILYTGTMAIIRYDQGLASRLHALFPSNEFQTVVDYYQKRYGDPTEIWKRSIAPLAEPRRENPTIAWRSRDPKTNAVTILEIRQFDDTRGGFPDTGRGAVMLYLANSPAIFPQVSSHELMRLRRDQRKLEQPG